MEEIMNEELLEQISIGIATVGTAKSFGKEAVQEATKGNFEKAREIYKQAKDEYFKAHSSHFKLIQKEASGEKTELSLLLIHMEDHIMTTSLYLEGVEEQINLLERVKKLEEKIEDLAEKK